MAATMKNTVDRYRPSKARQGPDECAGIAANGPLPDNRTEQKQHGRKTITGKRATQRRTIFDPNQDALADTGRNRVRNLEHGIRLTQRMRELCRATTARFVTTPATSGTLRHPDLHPIPEHCDDLRARLDHCTTGPIPSPIICTAFCGTSPSTVTRCSPSLRL